MVLLLQINAQPASSPLVVPSTSHNQNDKRTPSPLLSAHPASSPLDVPSTSDNHNDRGSPSPTSVQTERSSSHPSVLGYTLHPKRVYDAQKIGVKVVDFKITFKNTRRYQELVNEFNSVMEDVVNEVLGDADPNDRVRFAILKGLCEVKTLLVIFLFM